MTYVTRTVTDSKSRLSFKVRNSESGNPWWYYLDLEGEPLYFIGNVCDTCNSSFGRVGSLPPDETSLLASSIGQQLREGLSDISQAPIDQILPFLPDDKYAIALLQFMPHLVERPAKQGQLAQFLWEHPKLSIPTSEWPMEEFAFPIVNKESLKPSVISNYEAQIKAGGKPTALAFSILDVRCPSGKMIEWRLAHILLDGHHKMMAAANLKQPITILSFLSKKNYYFKGDYFKDNYLEKTLQLRYE